MTLIKFTKNNLEYSGQYAWRLYSLKNGNGLYASLETEPNIVTFYGGILDALAGGANVTVGPIFLSQPDSAVSWILKQDNIEGLFVAPISDEDISMTAELNDRTALKRYNASASVAAQWSTDELTQPVSTLGDILLPWISSDFDGREVIEWLAGGCYDEICNRLASADANISIAGTGCGCNNSTAVDLNSCSALDKYRTYMNNLTIQKFGDINFIHRLLTITYEGTERRNEDLIENIMSFIKALSAVPTVISGTFNCPCVTNTSQLNDLSVNLSEALSLIGTEDECRRKVYITYWMSQMIKTLIA